MNSEKRHRFVATVLLMAAGLFVMRIPALALFGVGDTVFDPTMYAGQLLQLQQETATVTNLAQQLQYAIQNTTGSKSASTIIEPRKTCRTACRARPVS